MRNMKKLLGFLLVLSIGLQMLVIPVAASRNPYDIILANSLDEKNGSSIQVLADRVGAIRPGEWICYRELDFGNVGPSSVAIESTNPEGATVATIRLDKPTGEILAEVPITFSSGWGVGIICSADITAKVTGVHDIYISGNVGSMGIRNILFYEKGAAEKEIFSYEMYSPSDAFTDLEDTDCAEAVRLLHGLGIIPDKESGLYEPKIAISRGEFAYSIYRLFVPKPATEQEAKAVETVFTDVKSDYEYAEAIAYVSQNGIVNGVTETEFDPYSYITYQDALTIILRALGYKEIAEAEGGYPGGYINTAIKAKISISGIGYDEYVKKSQVPLLLEKVLYADYVTIESIKNGQLYLEQAEGILGATQNIYSGSGFVTATEVSMINMPESGLEHGYVSIDGAIYKTGTADVLGLLGFECDFWFEDKDGEKTLKYIAPKSSTTYSDISSAEDKIYSITDDKIEYCLNGETKEREIKIDSNVSVLYNGVALEGKISDVVDEPEAFKGIIRLVKNGNSNRTIFIEEYEDYIVESIDPHTSILKGTGVADEISLNAENDLVVLLNAKSKETTANKLNIGEIITVYRSKNTKGPKLIRGYVSDKTIQGKVTAIYDDEIYINGQSYKKSNNYSGSIKIGQNGIFNLNIYGELVAFNLNDKTETMVGLFLDVKVKEEPFVKEIYVKLVDNTGTVLFYPVAQKITYNGKRFEAVDILSNVTDGENVCRGLSELDGDEAFRFKRNSEGEISMIDTCDKLMGGSNDTMKKHTTNNEVAINYQKTSGILVTDGTMKYYMEDTALVFAYYNDVEETEKFWAAGQAATLMPASASTRVSGHVYSTEGNEHMSDLVVFARTIQWGRDWEDPIIVDEVAIGVDEGGDEITMVKGVSGGGKKVTYTISEAKVPFNEEREILSNAVKGDVIRVKLCLDMIADAEYIFFCDGAKSRNIAGREVEALINKVDKSTSAIDTTLKGRYIYGTVERKTDKYLVIKTGEAQDKTPITEVAPMPDKATLFYKRSDGRYFIAGGESATAIEVGDTVTVIIHAAKTSQVIVNDID